MRILLQNGDNDRRKAAKLVAKSINSWSHRAHNMRRMYYLPDATRWVDTNKFTLRARLQKIKIHRPLYHHETNTYAHEELTSKKKKYINRLVEEGQKKSKCYQINGSLLFSSDLGGKVKKEKQWRHFESPLRTHGHVKCVGCLMSLNLYGRN